MKKALLPVAVMIFGANICAADAEEIALDCQITDKSGETYKAHIETDGVGLTIRQNDGRSSYYANKKDGDSEYFLRITPSDIAFGSTYSFLNVRQEMIINRRTGEMVTNRNMNGENMPRVEVGQCEKVTIEPKKF